MTPSPLSMRAFGHRVFVAFLVCCLVVVAGWAAIVHEENAKVAQIRTAQIDPALLTKGDNYLFIGSDTRSFVKSAGDEKAFGSAEAESGQRSDTMMVAHLDPGHKTGALVSFPRDLWVDIPGHGTAKINAAFSYGGPQLAIETLKQDFNIPISHYLEVDFAGFRDLVNAIGTVPIYFPAPARDTNSGLWISTPGCHQLDGADALAYVRSRYYQYKTDGHWQYDPLSDLGRIRRQQYFIRSLAQAIIKTVTHNLFRADNVANKSVDALTRDKGLTASDLLALVHAFRSTDPNAFPMTTLPATNASRDGQSVLLLDDAAAQPDLARLRGQDQPGALPKIDPSSIGVTVENGSGVSGEAARALRALHADGFRVAAPASDADRSDYAVTQVEYAAGAEKQAQLVLAYLGGAGELAQQSSARSGVDVVVVLGRDFQQVSVPAQLQAFHMTPIAARRPAAGGTTPTTGPPANPGGAMPDAGC